MEFGLLIDNNNYNNKTMKYTSLCSRGLRSISFSWKKINEIFQGNNYQDLTRSAQIRVDFPQSLFPEIIVFREIIFSFFSES